MCVYIISLSQYLSTTILYVSSNLCQAPIKISFFFFSVVQGADWHWGPKKYPPRDKIQPKYVKNAALATLILCVVCFIAYLIFLVSVFPLLSWCLCLHIRRVCVYTSASLSPSVCGLESIVCSIKFLH